MMFACARRPGRTAILAWVGLTLALASPGCRDAPPRSIVLIVVDTLRRDYVSAYGAEASTPHMQALADRGQVFRNVQASFHQTTMSMGSLFTGLAPSIESPDREKTIPWTGRTWCGLARFAQSGPTEGCIPPEVETLPERLSRAGWFTVGVVSNSLLFAPAGFERGFDVWREVAPPPESVPAPRGRIAPRAAPRVLAALRGALEQAPRGDPLFVYLHYIDVHDYMPLLPMRRSYGRAVEAFDADLGKLFETLAREHVLDDAAVVLTSDHGELLGERHAIPGKLRHRGNPSFQSVLDIPLIVAPPTREDPDQMLRSQDLAALIGRIAGIDPPATIETPARSLRPDELLLTERKFLTYRRGPWKSVIHRTDPSRSALFDVTRDPTESTNVLDLHPEIFEEHRKRVAELTAAWAVAPFSDDTQTEADQARLRALGYLEQVDD